MALPCLLFGTNFLWNCWQAILIVPHQWAGIPYVLSRFLDLQQSLMLLLSHFQIKPRDMLDPARPYPHSQNEYHIPTVQALRLDKALVSGLDRAWHSMPLFTWLVMIINLILKLKKIHAWSGLRLLIMAYEFYHTSVYALHTGGLYCVLCTFPGIHGAARSYIHGWQCIHCTIDNMQCLWS